MFEELNDHEKSVEGIHMLASTMREYFKALTDLGFSPAEALALVISFQNPMIVQWKNQKEK